MSACKRLLRVALVGAPNAGKSTLLNRLVCHEVSSVSNKVHTTRSNTLGVYTRGDTQLEFYDSPGVINREHMFKHKLEDTLLNDPKVATQKCDLVAVIVDASNSRDQRRLNKGVLTLLTEHSDKRSILVLNKVDLIKDKRSLLDVGTRLTQGCIEGKCTMTSRSLRQLSNDRIRDLNLDAHFEKRKNPLNDTTNNSTKYNSVNVIELDQKKQEISEKKQDVSPDSVGYKNFSQVFSVSALNDDGVDNLRESMIAQAKPVEIWPHGPDYLTNQTAADVAHNIIRGRVMDYVEQAVPYLLRYNYLKFEMDDMGSLHVHLVIKCPQKYMVQKVVGEKGVNIFRIIEDSRELIAKTLACDVKLTILVEPLKETKQKVKTNAQAR